jgi:hypothetical protein
MTEQARILKEIEKKLGTQFTETTFDEFEALSVVALEELLDDLDDTAKVAKIDPEYYCDECLSWISIDTIGEGHADHCSANSNNFV